MSSFLFDGLALLCGCLFPLFRRAAPGAARNAVPDLACERALGERLPIRLRLLSHGARISGVCVCVCWAPPPSLYISLSRTLRFPNTRIRSKLKLGGGRGVCVCVCVGGARDLSLKTGERC